MALPDPHGAAREATAAVAMLERPPYGRRNRPRPRADLHHLPLRIVPHPHPARIARQAAGRFRGNVAPLLQHGLAGLRRVRQDCGVHVDHHLVPRAGATRIEPVMPRRLRQPGQRLRLLRRPAGSVSRNDQAGGVRPGRGRGCRVAAGALV
ncbi:MAG: hypothetical protein ACREK9_19830, partial [Candidatus Rokuibacteriota bacterium]